MELTIEHLAPYLPYDLEVEYMNGVFTVDAYFLYEVQTGELGTNEFKPLLRPLSQLTEEIEHGGRKFVPLNELWDSAECDAERDWIDQMRVINLEGNDAYKVMYAPYTLMYRLKSWHFDIYGLIDNDLAIEKDQG